MTLWKIVDCCLTVVTLAYREQPNAEFNKLDFLFYFLMENLFTLGWWRENDRLNWLPIKLRCDWWLVFILVYFSIERNFTTNFSLCALSFNVKRKSPLNTRAAESILTTRNSFLLFHVKWKIDSDDKRPIEENETTQALQSECSHCERVSKTLNYFIIH